MFMYDPVGKTLLQVHKDCGSNLNGYSVFILQDAHDCGLLPHFLAARRGNASIRQGLCNIGGSLAHHERPIYIPHDLRLFFNHPRKTVFAFLISKKMLIANAYLSIGGAFPFTPGNVIGDGAAFFLRYAGHDGNQ